MCRICWATIEEGDFETSGALTEANGKFKNLDTPKHMLLLLGVKYYKT